MSRRPSGLGDDPRVIPFRPRPRPRKAPPGWWHSLKLFGVLLAAVGLLRWLYAGMGFDGFDLLFVILLAGSIALGDFVARRKAWP